MGLNLDFSNLTNNSYTESVQPLFSVDLTKFGLGNEKPTSQETEIRLNFLKKMEAILSLGQEAKFLYRPETSQPIADFCQNYRDAVNEAYHYEMILQDLKKQAKQPALIRDKTFDEFADESGEPKYRKKLTDAFENLTKTIKELEQGEIFLKMEKQISLIKI
ncbi:hypothetical protein [Lactococcus raffinolactis]|uniref:hypothetical protein n=1 Tax=Pseudolactococcus raffinolactis TaxID=1366 RepID=UPI0039AF1BBF